MRNKILRAIIDNELYYFLSREKELTVADLKHLAQALCLAGCTDNCPTPFKDKRSYKELLIYFYGVATPD